MFKKYPSLTQSYANKDIDRFMNIFGDELKETNWIISEKIHGANVSFLFQPNKDVLYFSRNNPIVGANFYHSEDLFQEYAYDKLINLQKWVNQHQQQIRVFGELYGPGIQKGVYYGSERKIKFYDMLLNDKWQTQENFENFFYDGNLGTLIVPKLAIVPSVKDALEFDAGFDSKLSDREDNISEGVVIKPFNKIFVEQHNGSLFYIKNKNEKFIENQAVRKIRTETQYTEEVNEWHNKFLGYINRNRVDSVFSKEGEIQSHSELGKFIPLIHIDALEDFRKDHSEDFVDEEFDKKERKYIFNSSKSIVNLLKEYL